MQKMKRLEILAVGLACGLVVSVILNVVVLMEFQQLYISYDESVQQLGQSWNGAVDEVLVEFKHVIQYSGPFAGRLYIWTQADSLLIRATSFNYTITLMNPSDSTVQTSMPELTVTLGRGDSVVYSQDIAFNMTGPIVLGPHEERVIYPGTIALAESVQEGIYCLRAVAREEPSQNIVLRLIEFQTLPTLVMLTH